MFSGCIRGKYLCNKPEYEQKSSFLFFNFLAKNSSEVKERLKKSEIQHVLIDQKSVFTIDGFFTPEEMRCVREFSRACEFNEHSYGSLDTAAIGEKPSLTTDSKQRWSLFFEPPSPICHFYDFLSFLTHELSFEILTMPWALFNGISGSPAIIANKVQEVKVDSMVRGKHKDFDPTKKLAFKIPSLYGGPEHEECYANGAVGKPYLLTMMIYSIAENFSCGYEMGTAFFSEDGAKMQKALCKDMRIVIFEGDIKHSIAASNMPEGINTWRVSYVYKLVFNPKNKEQSIRQQLTNFLACSGSKFKIQEELVF